MTMPSITERGTALLNATTAQDFARHLPENLQPAFEATDLTFDLVEKARQALSDLGVVDSEAVLRNPLFRNHPSYALRTAAQEWVLNTVTRRPLTKAAAITEAAALMDGQHTPALVAKLTKDDGWEALGNVIQNSDYPHKKSLVFVMWNTARRDDRRVIPGDLLASAYFLLGWHQLIMKDRLKYMLDGRRCGLEACNDAWKAVSMIETYHESDPKQYLIDLAWDIRERNYDPHVLAMLAKNVSASPFMDPLHYARDEHPALISSVQSAILEVFQYEWCTTELMQEGALLGGEHTVEMFDRLVRRGDWEEVKEVLFRSSDYWRMKCAKQLIERGWETVHKASTMPPDVFRAALLSLPQLSVGSRKQIRKLLRIALERQHG